MERERVLPSEGGMKNMEMGSDPSPIVVESRFLSHDLAIFTTRNCNRCSKLLDITFSHSNTKCICPFSF